MQPEQMIEACMKQAEFSAGRHDARRQYEWKVSLGLWAAILGSIGVLKGRTIPWWICALVAVFYAGFWLRGIWVANENDKRRVEHFRLLA